MTSEARASEALSVTVDAKVFVTALAQANRYRATRSGIEVLRGVMLEASADLFTLAATSMDVFYRARVDAEIGSPGRALLEDPQAVAAVLKGTAGPLLVTLEARDAKRDSELVVVSWTGAAYRFPTLNADDFPAWPALGADRGTLDAGAFSRIMGAVGPVYSRDETRPVLTGCRVMIEASGTLRIVATDSYRLALDEEADACYGEAAEATLPGVGLSAVAKLAAGKGAPERIGWATPPTAAGHEPTHLGFHVGPAELTLRRVEGQYPGYAQLFPDSFEVEHVLDGGELAAVAKRLSGLGAHVTARLTVSPDGTVTLAARGSYNVECEEALPTRATIVSGRPKGKDPRPHVPLDAPIGFNAAFLAEAAAFCGEKLTLRLVSPLRPAVFLNGREGAKHLLMPIRIA